MRILIYLGHPAHFHLFKNVINSLQKKGCDVLILIKKKDVLEELLINKGLKYHNILAEGRKDSKIGIMWGTIKRAYRLLRFVVNNRPSLLVGTSVENSWIGKIMNIPVINVNEDDAKIVPLYAKLSYPFASEILSPITCNNGKWEQKSIKYAGFQKLAYLHPNQFKPDIEIVKRYLPIDKPYFLLRFAKLNAHHDVGANGISTKVAQNLIDILSKYGNIYITTERELELQFEKYRLNINPLDIHHIMASAKLYIGDSQSMAVEAAMLGVPSIRFNSFAGKIGVLEELENKYELTHSISPNYPEELYRFVYNLLSQENLRDTYQSRRKRMLADKIDVTAFFTWFIENYPESKKIIKENPDYQYRFK
ncbi:DUF354 domain-containing protein [Bacteroides sp.]|uniref:DUF354 domain-containing protein n=1 Tax=Bacteroides sp. TaxID=29523 RepID=UPI00261BEC6A|nr:DUF354 domain-containing protein [Bacteroides sp.]MDD3038751.1 DUF354 domain-containing protein [Bacteroides sp.]